ncbi:DsbE family thiol:disulfide interchange protein [Phaeovulum sp.]|uniref:DsbE family thiol:disulfide interchange protein n=1 Tax=Phaeovulum sp. TaxID=2934796 RepID=UPI0027302D1D|nr:DsbE family thiol:disulfide interchange protein [Phaeovulum sp.]MDP1667658.1 DsbE family thiol:disulfide interchange protein [Phaeovulum sp.]MDZ4118451.1 DsbE family thiol:disulfide interchange protein [Phaeovulum sp.]
MARISPLMLAPPLLFAALAGMFVWGMGRDNPRELPSALIGQQAPALVVTALADLPPLSSDVLTDGTVKLVNFWASWCAPCRIEHPIITQLTAEGIPVYGVNYKDDPAAALKFLSELGNPYAAIGADLTGRDTAVNWGVYGVPETFVIDGQGKVLYRFAGALTPNVVEARIRRHFAAN